MVDRSSARRDGAFAVRPTPPKKPARPSTAPAERPAVEPSGLLEPTILLVGADSAFEPALRLALARHRVYVETTSADAVSGAVVAVAPDLVLLVGPAARDGGSRVLESLTRSTLSSVTPVAILDDDPALDVRLRAFRHGAAAVIPRSASIDAIAEQVAKLAREIPERGSESLGVVGEATLNEFVATLGKELRSGILSVQSGEQDAEAVRLVLGSGRPLAAFIDDFVRQVKSHVVHAEPLRYEFAEHAAGTLALLDPRAPVTEAASVSVKGIRVALADDDTGRADSVAQELRSRGVSVVVSDLSPSDARFNKLRQADPQLLLIGESQIKGEGFELLRRMRRDTRLRWASLLVVRWDELWSDALSVPALDRLATALVALCEADRSLHGFAESGESFDTRLEITGPARCLRALSGASRPLRISVSNARVTLRIDVSDGLVVGAAGESTLDPGQRWEGALALSAFLVLSSGRVHVAPVLQPAVTNVMATVDVALNMADSRARADCAFDTDGCRAQRAARARHESERCRAAKRCRARCRGPRRAARPSRDQQAGRGVPGRAGLATGAHRGRVLERDPEINAVRSGPRDRARCRSRAQRVRGERAPPTRFGNRYRPRNARHGERRDGSRGCGKRGNDAERVRGERAAARRKRTARAELRGVVRDKPRSRR